MKFKSFCLIIINIIGLLQCVAAQEIVKIGRDNGLSNNNIACITQDRNGFLWIATKDGLNRFDASAFTIFKTSETDSNSISSNALNYVYADKHNNQVWIATEKTGVDAYNYKTNVYTHYKHIDSNENSLSSNGITFITEDNKSNLWFANYSAGIDQFDKKRNKFTHYNQTNVKGLGSNYNWTLMVANDETVYAGHINEGFSIINTKNRTAVNFRHKPKDPSSLPDNTVTSIYKDSQGNIWIGTRNGLVWFDPATYQMKIFQNNPKNSSSLSHNFVQRIIETHDHKLWIGTEIAGVNILDLSKFSKDKLPADVSFEHIKVANTPEGLSSPSVQSLFQDSFGNIWIGGLGGGINFIPGKEPFFKKISYLPYIGNTNSLAYKYAIDLCTDANNKLWVANGTEGVCVYDKGQKIKQINKFENSPTTPYISCVYNDCDNTIWIGSELDLTYQYNDQTGKMKRLTCFDDYANIPVYSIFEDSKKNIWLCTDVGLFVYNKSSESCKIYTSENSELTDNITRTVAEDALGNIWVGSFVGGLSVFNSQFKLIFDYGKMYNFSSVYHIYRDSKGRMLVASQNDLFIFRNISNESVLRIGQNYGLEESSIRAIVEGNTADEFWLSSTNGISYINLNKKKVSNFDVRDNISFGDYLPGSISKAKDGTIFCGSQNGITWFNQVLNVSEETIPKIEFTSFLISNNTKNINEFINIPFSDTMLLYHNQNSFQINFNSLDFSLSNKVDFIFQMKGLDNNWYLIDKERNVTFRNLKPGNYVFNIKARLHNKEWSPIIKSMYIKIEPPLWYKWWAIVIYLIVLAIIAYYIIKFYKKKLKVENDLLLEKRSRHQEHLLNDEKLKFYTNITHELRTPMTLILGPLEDLIADNKLPEDQLKKINSIHRVASRLLQIINQILDFRKTENKSRKLRVVKDDFVKYVRETSLKYKELNQNNNIDFQIRLPETKIEMFFDPEVITIILDNLISNAFKYTKEGTIRLEIKNYTDNDVDKTEIIVKDTGYGISPEDLPNIFERYYQAKHAQHPVKGTGIGLALVKNLVELHEAEVRVQSEQNVGSTFKVKFITNNSYPDAIHVNQEEVLSEKVEEEISSEQVILIIDDNQEIIDYIRDSLVDNYTVLTAENGKIGYEIACEKTPDIVISDIMMPVMDGIELCTKMKQDVRTSHIPVVLLTAKNSQLDQSEGYSAGADSYLTKPFSINLLKSRLTNILKTRKKLSTVYSTNFKDKKVLYNESTSKLDKEFLEKLTAVIEKNLEDEEMNISFIASQLNMSHSTLYRKIKALTNITANEYIRKVRINTAEQLLVTNKYTISEIMYRIGINSSSYFRQCFKDEFGMNPSEYLQKLKGE